MIVDLNLHVQPGARRTEVAGRHGDAIKVRGAGSRRKLVRVETHDRQSLEALLLGSYSADPAPPVRQRPSR
ncbi:MAG: hypothetical protein H0V09_00195 [Gemmatimonadetes bacterium]|nr:hypothetical protein [Gemmatimonadota bacterium]